MGGTAKLIVSDKMPILDGIISSLKGNYALVGIPEENNSRPDGISNAALLYIHTNGSPANNLPERPIIEPAIETEDHKRFISESLKKAITSHLSGNKREVEKYLHEAGQAGENFSKGWFTDARNNWPDIKIETIRRKLRKRKALSSSGYKTKKGKMGARGRMEATIQFYYEGGEGINTILVDTDEMRKSITHVVNVE